VNSPQDSVLKVRENKTENNCSDSLLNVKFYEWEEEEKQKLI